MKKFIMSIVSLVLAGSMAFGLAACGGKTNPDDDNKDDTNNNLPSDGTEGGNNGGEEGGGSGSGEANKELVDAISATLAVENYKMTMTTSVTTSYLYNGALITEDTTITNTPMGEMNGLEFLQLMAQGEEVENPSYRSWGESIYKYDFVNGKVSITDIDEGEDGEPEEDTDYYEVDGTSISHYYLAEVGSWNQDTQETEYTYIPYSYVCSGYASNDKAKAVLKSAMSDHVDGPTLKMIMEAHVKGIGDNSSREGTLEELVDLFEYDATTRTYTITVDASESGGVEYSNCKVAITVIDGKATKMVMSVSMDQDLSVMIEGLSVSAELVSTSNYSDFGTVSITVPAEYKQVEEQNIFAISVLSSEDDWKTLLEDYDNAKEFHLNYYEMQTVEGELAEVNTEIYVDTETSVAMVETRSYTMTGDSTYTRTYYKVENGKLLTYNGIYEYNQEYEYNEFKGYSEPVETDVTGDATAALIAVLPQIAKDYFAGFEGGAISGQYSKFDYSSFTELSADLKLNGKDVKVEVSYSYWDNQYEISSIYVNYSENNYFSVFKNARGHLDSYSPDKFTD